MGQFVAIRPECQFDPATESVVREAVAQILHHYEYPFAHKVRIELPDGRYLLHFEFVEPEVKAALLSVRPEAVTNSVGYYAGRDMNTLYLFMRPTI
jgi:hypothetical protein